MMKYIKIEQKKAVKRRVSGGRFPESPQWLRGGKRKFAEHGLGAAYRGLLP